MYLNKSNVKDSYQLYIILKNIIWCQIFFIKYSILKMKCFSRESFLSYFCLNLYIVSSKEKNSSLDFFKNFQTIPNKETNIPIQISRM